jgi:hypothetical protein
MLRALPVLIILGLAIYSFFDVLKTEDLLIRRGPKAMWMILALVPVVGAGLWFLFGRPVKQTEAYPGPRVISLHRNAKQAAPDDDASFLRKLEQEEWLRKRREARAQEKAASDKKMTKDTPAPKDTGDQASNDGPNRQTQSKKQSPGEQDL